MAIKLKISKIRTKLLNKRKILLEKIKTDDQQPQWSINPDRSDLAWQYIKKQKDAMFNAKDREKLIAIESALERMENGTYGICRICGRGIHPVRLETIPTTSTCIKCKKRDNRRER
jgi:RNA polymerase-binding protein DksA